MMHRVQELTIENIAAEKAFNEWHRRDSIKRFLSGKYAKFEADQLRAIDIDLVEYCARTGRVVLLHEVARDNGKDDKPTAVVRALAEQSGCRALCTLVTLADTPNPASPEYPDIAGFRVRQVWPKPTRFHRISVQEYAVRLNELVKRLKAE